MSKSQPPSRRININIYPTAGLLFYLVMLAYTYRHNIYRSLIMSTKKTGAKKVVAKVKTITKEVVKKVEKKVIAKKVSKKLVKKD